MKTHEVFDLVYGDAVFEGTEDECMDYISSQSDFFTYQVRRKYTEYELNLFKKASKTLGYGFLDEFDPLDQPDAE